MKRRKFLALSSASLAGTIVPVIGLGQVRPCPPGTLSVTGGQTALTQCVATPRGSAPGWFIAQAARTWNAVAANATVNDCFYSPFLIMAGNAGDRNNFNDYSGATIDQSRREMLMVANGGHADYLGNEGYALALWAETPYWYRLNDPSPSNTMLFPETNGQVPYLLRDGRSASMHTNGIQFYSNGKVWYGMQQYVSSGGGSPLGGLVAFDREFPGIPYSNSQPALAWANNSGPWTSLGAWNNSPHALAGIAANSWVGTTACYDSNSGYIYMTAPQNSGLSYLRLNTANGTHGCYFQQSIDGLAVNAPGRWHAQTVLEDRPFRTNANGVYFSRFENSTSVFLMSLPLSQGNGSWAKKVTGPTANVPTRTYGGASVYHSGAIYFMNWAEYGSQIFKLTLPVDLESDSAWLNAWSIEHMHTAGSPIPIGVNPEGQFSKFNIVRDMGNGQAALVCAPAHDGPTWIYKLA